MNDPMTILRADHREVRTMLKQLAETDEGTEREQLVEQVRKALAVHMDAEERYVYPLVRDRVGAEDEEEAEIEHGLARDGVTKMVEMVAAPGFGAVVEMLAAGIEHHVKEEETELLPALKEELPREEWLALGDTIAKAKADAGMPVKAKATTKRSARRSTSKAKSTSSSSKSSNGRR